MITLNNEKFNGYYVLSVDNIKYLCQYDTIIINGKNSGKKIALSVGGSFIPLVYDGGSKIVNVYFDLRSVQYIQWNKDIEELENIIKDLNEYLENKEEGERTVF